MAAPLTGVITAASLSGLLRSIEGLGEPGTVLSASERAGGPGMMGVIWAGVMVAGPVSVAPELRLEAELSPREKYIAGDSPSSCFIRLPGAGSVVMVTLLCPVSAPRPASYISVVWLKLGMAMAGATTALDTVRFTGLAWLLPLSLQGHL